MPGPRPSAPCAQTALSLIGGVAGALLLASGVGATLTRAAAHGQPPVVIDNLDDRVHAGWVMVAAMAAAFFRLLQAHSPRR